MRRCRGELPELRRRRLAEGAAVALDVDPRTAPMCWASSRWGTRRRWTPRSRPRSRPRCGPPRRRPSASRARRGRVRAVRRAAEARHQLAGGGVEGRGHGEAHAPRGSSSSSPARRCGWAASTSARSGPGRHRRDAGAARRRRDRHALELPARDPGVEDRAGAGVRQRGGVQAGAARPGERVGADRDPLARRPAAGDVQPGERGGSTVGTGSSATRNTAPFPARGREARSPCVRRAVRAGAAGDGQQEPARRARRRGLDVAVDCAIQARSSRPASGARRPRAWS